MAEEDQLRILKQGPAAWNEWRSKAGDIQVDLSEASLSGANLSEAELEVALAARIPAYLRRIAVRFTQRRATLIRAWAGASRLRPVASW
jgi:uncharacterized protein YjbI with pentapeptide repeats